MSSPDTETTTSTEPPAYVKPYAQRFLARAEDLSNRQIGPALPSGAERVQGLSGDEQAAISALRGQVDGGVTNQAAAGLGQFLDPNAAFSPLANQLVDQSRQATIDNFNTSVAPSITAASRRSGSYGNTGVAELDAIKRYQLGRALGENEANVRGQFLDRSLSAQGLVPGLAGAQRGNIQALGQAGAVQRGLGQQIRDIDFQNLLSARDEPFTRLNVLGSALGTAAGGGGRTTSIGPGQQGNPLIGGLGAAGALLGGLGTLYGAF